ncbi:class I SAM-dependent methyltransferase [Actinopolymorpha alba]|uniref:class I SAM-dependent methyltransferase n=1 Tax=Actinopolymorpha alba TaxID=533267 RepID=UPI000373F97A|nr:class I SAM-dependent methyltransferase [Actinopolymorpha alba]
MLKERIRGTGELLAGYRRAGESLSGHQVPQGTGQLRCPCCGGWEFSQPPVLWPKLIEEWQLTEEEVRYIDRQQGMRCMRCRMTLRSLALAHAITTLYGPPRLFPFFMVRHPLLRVLEVNAAGNLHHALRFLPRTVSTNYPEVDMMELPFRDASFDLVVHSDTLEHVPDPVRGLRECFRVLKPRRWVCFTIPVVVGRLTRSRTGKPPSFHGSPPNGTPDCLVQTEYGADMWTHLMEAGARECRIISLEYPAALAIAGRK